MTQRRSLRRETEEIAGKKAEETRLPDGDADHKEERKASYLSDIYLSLFPHYKRAGQRQTYATLSGVLSSLDLSPENRVSLCLSKCKKDGETETSGGRSVGPVVTPASEASGRA